MIPIKTKYALSPIERETLDIINYYEYLRREKTKCSYMAYSRSKDPRISKAFKYFQQIIEISKKENTNIPDPRFFIRSQFESSEICPPHRLLKKESWENYKGFIDYKIMEQSSINVKKNIYKNIHLILNDLNNTKEFFINFSIENFGEINIDYSKIFSKTPRIWISILHGLISPYFLSVSKSYNSSIIDPEFKKELPNNLGIYKEEVLSNSIIIENMKRLFGDEIDVRK